MPLKFWPHLPMSLVVKFIDFYMGGVGICCRGLFLAVILLAPSFLRAEETMPVLEVGSQTYTNVTVTSKTPRYIIIAHAQGLSSIQLKDLSREVLKQLGYKVPEPSAPNAQSFLKRQMVVDPRIQEMQAKTVQEIKDRLRLVDPRVLRGAQAGLGVLYLFFCYCSMLICKKVGQEPGALVWIPILQTFPLLRAAGMPAWWFLLCLVPVANIGVGILWCVKICQARGKSSWLALLLVLPVANIFAFLHLAFADGALETNSAPERITFD